MDRKKFAIELHNKNFNCAQSVVCSYCSCEDCIKYAVTILDKLLLGIK